MTDNLAISYQIESIDRDALNNFRGCDFFLMTAMQGSARLSDGYMTIEVESCNLLELSYRLVYLCIMPMLYGTKESTLSEAINVASSLEGDALRILIPQRGQVVEMTLSPLQALAEVGRFHAELLKALFAVDDRFRTDGRIRNCLSLASVQLK